MEGCIMYSKMTHTLIETEQRKRHRIAFTEQLGKREAKANFEQIKSINARAAPSAQSSMQIVSFL